MSPGTLESLAALWKEMNLFYLFLCSWIKIIYYLTGCPSAYKRFPSRTIFNTYLWCLEEINLNRDSHNLCFKSVYIGFGSITNLPQNSLRWKQMQFIPQIYFWFCLPLCQSAINEILTSLWWQLQDLLCITTVFPSQNWGFGVLLRHGFQEVIKGMLVQRHTDLFYWQW